MIRVRQATLDDVAEILPRTQALNAEEGIVIDERSLEAALRRLLTEPSLGAVWLAEDDRVIGHAVVTYGYDLEFGGRDAFLTELWVDERERRRGAGSALLAAIADALRAIDVRALHLQVRTNNAALRLYERHGFVRSPRVIMTRRLD
ncbi:MAG TPA: GNAT family N-acetyltransferase [Kofleriaceae bacterium]